MNGDVFSVIVRCRYDPQSNATWLQIVDVETGEEVRLSDSAFLLRISPGEHGLVMRCFIRHLASGREAYVQGGSKLRDFVKACLLKIDEPQSGEPGAPGG